MEVTLTWSSSPGSPTDVNIVVLEIGEQVVDRLQIPSRLAIDNPNPCVEH